MRRLLNSTYVDDIIAGGDTEEEAFKLYVRSRQIFREGGFHLRKFVSNSRHLQERIETQRPSNPSRDEPTYSEATLGVSHLSETEEHKVLGVLWNPDSDRFLFDASVIKQHALDLTPTKRNLVSLIGKFYDPLGFLSPVIIRFKILFQKLCLNKSDWDEVIPEDLDAEWKRLVSDLEIATPLSLPRSYFFEVTDPIVSATLCGFCDASIKAYAAVVYLVLKTETGSSVQFVAAKTRVAPLKGQTIPRLELLSALLLPRLIVSTHSSLQHCIPSLNIKCFTDSQVALYWILGSDKEWKPFVQNRVTEIRRNVHSKCWHHCPGIVNPADLPSRGITMLELSASKLWHSGPKWLHVDVPPHSIESLTMPESCTHELKLKPNPSHNLLVTEKMTTIGSVMQCEDFSDLQRLFRVTAYVLRAVERFKTRRSSREALPNPLTRPEIAAAEQHWITHVQKELVQQRNFSTLKKQLRLFRDEKGLWRCGGRLQNADIPYAAKHPVLLPRSHHFTRLVIRDAHIRVCHNGVKETLTEIRSRYWVVKGRSLTRSLVHQCTTCRRYESAPFRGPPPPPLPEFRVKDDPAFTYTGVDFAGPVSVRKGGVSSDNVKVWICVFTCLVTRAIHLDVVCDLSTETFLRCLKRFAARRGLPRKFLSDNGRIFQAAAKFIFTVFKDLSVQEYLALQGSQWIFNVERAPWWGGVFERMVRSTKRCLRKMIGRASLTRDELLTAVVEIEAVINS